MFLNCAGEIVRAAALPKVQQQGPQHVVADTVKEKTSHHDFHHS